MAYTGIKANCQKINGHVGYSKPKKNCFIFQLRAQTVSVDLEVFHMQR
ncbi:hypothetical protein NOC27_182 [Nitrosococcus oceani AFC27]|nr:hypothetical protein NOC27_182 [Nitrosococcus oceani AFC27]